MTEAGRRQLRRPRLPAEIDRAAEFSVPHPQRVSRQPWNLSTVRQNDVWPFGFAANLFAQDGSGIVGDSCQLFLRRLRTQIIWRPALFERVDVSGEILRARTNKFHDS